MAPLSLRLSLPLLGVAGGFLLLAPPRSRAYDLTGDQLALDQRDVRLCNNFTHPGANSNTVPDLSFPGSTGAALAVWKAAVEWGSELHSDGAGDPRQPGDLGSGGANFDFTWQELAGAIGGPDDNILSEISGSSGGVLAFTEIPTTDGWRIRFYQAWDWRDDPQGLLTGANEVDLQAVACHELGHALGLGHSNVSGATMFPTLPAVGHAWRSIEADDQAGVQALYGPRSASKPHVSSYAHLPGGLVRIDGAGFDASANAVWLTQPGGGGAPLEILGLASSGSAISFALPSAAAPGDLLVRVPGSSGASLSNAFPFDPLSDPCFQPAPYGTGKLTSAGSVAMIGFSGHASLQHNDLRMRLVGAPGGVPAVLFRGDDAQQVPFYGGTLLVQPPLVRMDMLVTDAFGFAEAAVPVSAAMVGTTQHYQYWFSDPADPFGAGTSNALRVRFCP